MKIYFCRHGETTGDVEGRFGGDYDDHLSDKGNEQSAELAQKLADKKIDVIVSSSLFRTQETAEHIARITGVNIITIAELRERNSYGIITGMTKEEALAAFPDLVPLVKDRHNTIIGAESYEDFSHRISRAFASVDERFSGKTIAIITHGGPMRVLFRDILQLGELESIGDCSFVVLDKGASGFTVGVMDGVVTAF